MKKEIIRIIVNAIVSILTVLGIISCTTSMSISKNNNNSDQRTEQTSTSAIDSTNININNK